MTSRVSNFRNTYSKPPNKLLWLVGILLLYTGIVISIFLAIYNCFLLFGKNKKPITDTQLSRAWGLWITTILIAIIGFGLKRASNYGYGDQDLENMPKAVNKYGEEV